MATAKNTVVAPTDSMYTTTPGQTYLVGVEVGLLRKTRLQRVDRPLSHLGFQQVGRMMHAGCKWS
jgi:hypothetical protein